MQALAERLHATFGGATLARADVLQFSALKTFDPGIEVLDGRRVVRVSRRGKYLVFGLGDVKLLVGVGLMLGLSRTVSGLLFGLLLSGLVLATLLVLRRISRRSYVPFGPFLIIGALWGIVLR